MNDYGNYQQNFDSVILAPDQEDPFDNRLRLPWQIPVFVLVAAILIGVILNALYYNPAYTMEGAILKYQLMLNCYPSQAGCLAPDEYWEYLSDTTDKPARTLKSRAAGTYTYELSQLQNYYGDTTAAIQITDSREASANELSAVASFCERQGIAPSRVKQVKYLTVQIAYETVKGSFGGNKNIYAIQIDMHWYLATWDEGLCFIFDSPLPSNFHDFY